MATKILRHTRKNSKNDPIKTDLSSLKEGWLMKQGGKKAKKGLKHNWRRRYISVTDEGNGFGPRIYCYKSHATGSPKIIDLSDFDTIQSDPKRKYAWRLESKTNSNVVALGLYADTQDEYDGWLEIFTALVARTNKQRRADSAQQELKKKEKQSNTWSMWYNLYIKVCDAKELHLRPHPARIRSHCDPYCVLKVESSFLRTRTIWNNHSPIWNEDFNITLVDPETATLTVTVWDEEQGWQDLIIGKIEIPIPGVKTFAAPEQWHTLTFADSKGYVSGDIHLKVRYHPPTMIANGSLFIKVVEARNLASKDSNGLSDPYVKLLYNGEKQKSKTKKKTLNPFYNEDFEFNVPQQASPPSELRVSLWDWDFAGTNDFMGLVKVNIKELVADQVLDSWFSLMEDESMEDRPRKKGGKEKDEKEKEKEDCTPRPVGTIRLCLKFLEELVLPGIEYNDLLVLLIGDPSLRLVQAFSKTVTPDDLEELSRVLCRIFDAKGGSFILLDSLTGKEIADTNAPEVIFRGNTLATKCLDAYMKLIGIPYLRRILNPVISSIYDSKGSFEVDPSKLEKGQDAKKNFVLLEHKAGELLEAIFNSLDEVPPSLREVFSALRQKVLQKWSSDRVRDVTRYTVISGFYFLRFVNPALTSPKRMGVMDDHPDMKTARALTLIAKIVQNLGNLVEFGAKEAYMKEMNPFILRTNAHMKSFLDGLATPSTLPAIPVKVDVWFEKDMAYIHNYLIGNRNKLKEHCAPDLTERLDSIMDVLQQAKLKYLACSGRGVV